MPLYSWCTTSYIRHYPLTPHSTPGPLSIEAVLNENFSFQAVVRLVGESRQKVSIEAKGPGNWNIRIRRAGYVPVPHHNTPIEPDPDDIEGFGRIPGYVPDPLFNEQSLLLPEEETHAFWLSVQPGPGANPGQHNITVSVCPENSPPIEHQVQVYLYDIELQPRRDFRITHWLYNDAIMDWYQTKAFDEQVWSILPAYIQNIVAHGQDTLYVPVFTPPTDGVKRPTQLLHVQRKDDGTYQFDWRDVERYVKQAKACGITHFEWSHLITQWGAKHAIRIYKEQGAGEQLLWDPETSGTSDTYKVFLSQFLSELQRFISVHEIEDHSFFHVSDEPHGAEHLANYKAARKMLNDLAPWMKVMDALTEIEFASQGLTDMPIPSIQTALDFVKAEIPSWCYYCCGPRGRYLNRLLDTPLSKIAMHGLLFYRWPFQGFLHWGYNYWYKSQTRQLIDPFTVQDAQAWDRNWAFGDPFVVYPGPDGPIDSIRWEVFGESLQDYALLQTLGIDREDSRLSSIQSFEQFPKHEQWRHNLRKSILSENT